MSRTVKACASLFTIRVAENMQYRAAAIANSSITIFWGLMQIVMFTVFFTMGDASGAAMTLPQTVTYAWLVQIMMGFIGRLGLDAEIRVKIINGDVALDLCRPLDIYTHWYVKTIANRVGSSVWRAAITLFAAVIMPVAFRLSPPASVFGFALFFVSVCSGMLLCAAFAMLLSAIRVGLTWGEGPTYIFEMVGAFLSGMYFPLQLWPDFMQRVLVLQPFAGLMDIPFRLYLGLLAPYESIWAIGLQVFWTVVFIAAGRILLNRRVSQLIVQGG